MYRLDHYLGTFRSVQEGLQIYIRQPVPDKRSSFGNLCLTIGILI